MSFITLNERKRLVKKFIAFDYTDIINDPNIFGVVYKITNLINDKVYIVKTSRYRYRMMEHIRGALDESYDNRSCHRLYQAMREDGIENFVSEIIYIAYNENDLLDMEIRFIVIFQSLLDEYGYNMSVDRLKYSKHHKSSKKRSISHTNKKHNKKSLKKNSDPIYAVNLIERKFIICDGCTMFGRYFFNGKDKAIFSHCIRDNTVYHNWYLLSADKYKIMSQLDKLDEKINSCKTNQLKEKLNNFKILYEIIANNDLETIEREFDYYSLEYNNDSDDIILINKSSRVIL